MESSERQRPPAGAAESDTVQAPDRRRGYAAAIVHHRSYADLERCLQSLASQAELPRFTCVLDADGDAASLGPLQETWSSVLFEQTPNLGYAGGANRALARVAEHAPEAEHVLLLNPDVVLERDFASAMLQALAARPDVALACGRLVRPGGAVLDSAGIELPAHRRPRDRGAGAPDRGQYATTEEVWGAGGAALFVRRAAAEDLAIEGEVFDEDFFLYHEDTDLSWRARLLGWKVLYVAEARAVHGRTWRAERRFEMDVAVRRHSFKNHYLEMIKNERGARFWRDLPAIAVWEVLRLGYAVLRDRAVLPAYADAWRLAGRAWRKRRIVQRRAAERHRRGELPWLAGAPHASR